MADEISEERHFLNDGRNVLLVRGGGAAQWAIWLDQKQDFDGVCLGHGATRLAAIGMAIDLLDAAMMKLIQLEVE
jgi:hypothetical protein